jgi:hypothetical protein
MKSRLIRQFQHWANTVFSPTLEPVYWNTETLNQKVDALAKKVNQQQLNINDLMTAVLFERWSGNPSLLHSRAEFGYWLNFLGLFGDGAEIGVYRGEYSEQILRTWHGRCLFSVDPWGEFESSEYDDVCNVSQVGQDDNFKITDQRLRPFGSRSVVIRKTSKEASEEISDESLDFVYIDAQHHYQAVKEDLALWECKVKPGGIIGGHDYLDGRIETGTYGVRRAVDEWSKERNYELIVTREGPFPSWFVRKESRRA